MALYEITFLTKEEADPGVRQLIEEVNGTIGEESTLGRRRLVYQIQKETQAVYTTLVFEIEPEQLAELDRKLRQNSAILRYLLIRKVAAKQAKEVSKAVREAIAQAEKLEDTVEEKPEVPMSEVELPVDVEEQPAPVAEPVAEKPARKPRVKKVEKPAEIPETAEEATEEERMKALEDKLGEILKD